MFIPRQIGRALALLSEISQPFHWACRTPHACDDWPTIRRDILPFELDGRRPIAQKARTAERSLQ